MYYEEYDDWYVEPTQLEADLGNKLESIKGWVEELAQQIYKDGDIAKIEDSMEELCNLCDVACPNTFPVIRKRSMELFNFAKELSQGVAL